MAFKHVHDKGSFPWPLIFGLSFDSTYRRAILFSITSSFRTIILEPLGVYIKVSLYYIENRVNNVLSEESWHQTLIFDTVTSKISAFIFPSLSFHYLMQLYCLNYI